MKLFVDMVSQPSRAVVLLCRVNKIPVEISLTRLARGETRTPAFRAISPFAKVPALQDGDYTLVESHAIMKYLVGTHEELVAPHWYPRDLKTRCKVDAMLDVHHTLVRPMSAYVFNKVLGPMGGLPSDPSVLPAAEANMGRAFKVLESILKAAGAEKGRVFLAGTAEPSIADLSSACELAQAAVLEDIDERLRPFPLVRAWQGWVRDATQPHWDEAHAMLNKVVAKVKEARL